MNRSVAIAGAAVAASGVILYLSGAGELIGDLAILGLFVVLPGIALVRLLLPGGDDAVGRLAIAVGVGLAVVILTGVIADRTPLTIRAAPLLVLAILLVALLFQVPRDVRRSNLRALVPSLPSGRPLILFGLSLFIVSAALAISRMGADLSQAESVVQLWLLPSSSGMVRVGAADNSASPVQWRIVVSADGVPVSQDDIVLQPGQEWQKDLPAGQGKAMTATLSRPGESQPVRKVALSSPTE